MKFLFVYLSGLLLCFSCMCMDETVVLNYVTLYRRLQQAGFQHFADVTYINNKLADKSLQKAQVEEIVDQALAVYKQSFCGAPDKTSLVNVILQLPQATHTTFEPTKISVKLENTIKFTCDESDLSENNSEYSTEGM